MDLIPTLIIACLSALVAFFYRRQLHPSSIMHLRTAEDPSIVQGQVICFGDSITQQSWMPGGTGAALANAYQRKLDVMNRGLSAAWGLPVIKQWLPRVGEDRPKIALLIIWFGANDAAMPPSPQALTIAQFKENLHTIISLVTSPSSPYFSPGTKILLLTPPPVNSNVRNAMLAARDPPQVPDRDSERTKEFAVATLEVGKEAGVVTVNTWSAIADAAKREGGLEKYLSDGLHLTADGYGVVTAGIANAIVNMLPELHWDKLDQVFPHWTDIIHNGALGKEFIAQSPEPTLLKK